MDSSIESKQKILAKHYDKLSDVELKSYQEALEYDMENLAPYCYSNYYFYKIISKVLKGEALEFDETVSLEAALEIRHLTGYATRSDYIRKEFNGILTEEEMENVLCFEPYDVDASMLDYIDAIRNKEVSNLRRHIGLLRFRKVLKKY